MKLSFYKQKINRITTGCLLLAIIILLAIPALFFQMSCSVKGTDSARIELTASATQLCVGSTGEILARLELADGSNEEGSFTFNSDSECLNFLGNNSKNGKFEVTTKGLATLSDGKLDPAQFPLDVNITVTHGKLSECLVITIVGVEKYNLVLNSNYDVDYEDITIDYGENLTLPECSRQGYNFLGWYLPDNSLLEGGIVGDLGDYPNGIYDAENPITVNVNALWEIETYNLVFNANGGRSCKDITLNYGDTLTLPETIREGYTFRGWYLSDNSLLKGGTAGDLGDYPNGIYDAENPITVDVTALWEIETYNLVFNTDGGSDCEDITINYGDTLTLPETSRAGYVFIGWYLSPEFDSGSLLTNGEIADLGEAAEGILTVNVYASWEIETYKLVFYTVEGTACDDIIINYGEELTLPTTIKEGHIFRWWYLLNGSYNDDKLEDGTAGDLGDYPGGIYDAENPITVNVGAIWSKEQYQLVFNSNGGSDCEDIFKFYDNEITLPVPTKEGYVFMGWYLSPDFSSDSRLTDGKVGDLGDYPDGIYDIKNPIDVNVYASWEIETYKLVFNANGGSDCEEVTLNYGDTLTLPVTTREGHVFIGWYLSDNSLLEDGTAGDLGDYPNGIYDAENPIVFNVTALWEIETYRLVFYTVEGTACDDIIIKYGEELTLPVSTKEGYVFRWWYLLCGSYNDDKLQNGIVGDLGDYPNGIYNAEKPITVNVGSIWSKEQYHLVFNSNGGSSCADIFKFYDNEITLPVPTREGYVFMGWYLSPDFNSDSRLIDGKVGDLGDYPDGVYDSDNPIIIVDVYAYWTLGEYNLIFESNGGTAFENMVAEFGKEIALPVPVKEGYVFTGWYLSDNTKIDSGIVGNLGPVTDVNLYAEWAVETYKLIFNTNGGTVCDDKTINYGEELTLPIPTKEGYALSGWYLSSELGVDSKLNDGIAGDLGDYPDGKYDAENPIAVNVYAAWEAETYKLLFNSNGGTVCDDKTINYGEELILPAPEKVGYTFTGWYLSAELTSESKLNDGIAGDLGDYLGGIYDGVNPIEVNVYACWEIETYSLIFNTNGGSACDIQKIEYGGELTLPVPTKEGCVFTGWYLAYDCNSNSELKNGIVGDLGNMDDGVINVNVYALWAMNSYNLIFNTNGGTACASMEVEYGSDVTLPVSTKEGYVFTGWYLSDNTRLHNGTVGNLGSSKDVQVYARWQIETYNLIFNANDGSDCEDITVTYGEHISLPTTTKDGYLFSGWYYGNQLVGGLAGDMGDYPDGKYDEQNHITVNIYAAWTLEKYNITFDADGGTACTNITVNYGNIIKLPETTKEGYVFMGWYLSDGRMLSDGIVGDLGDYPNGKFDEATPIAVKATASWKIETYTLIFNSNGGTDCENVEVEYDEAVILPVSAKEGYTFAGWYLNEDLAEESKFSNGTVGDLGDLFGGVINVNLYASWQIETYTLIFNTNGGSACASLPITYGGELNLPVPKKEGYEFSGWYLTSDFNSGSKLESGKVGDLGDLCDGVINVSLYALWNTYVELFGSGTQDSPYLIYNLVQLKDLAVKVNNGNNYSGVYFKLVNDITGVGEWTPIGNNNNSTYYSTATAAQNRRFAGIFDGDGHTISGYTITASNQTYTDTYVGLFGYIAAGGVVQNLRVAPVKIDGKSTRSTGSKGGGHYGAIAGINSGSIINCTVVSGEVSGQATLDTHVGGIVGYMFINGARVEGCTVESGVSVTGAAGRCVSHGGIVGSVNNGIIYSCTNKASVSGTNSKSSAYDNGVKGYTFLGGIAGVSCAVLINCTNSGSVSGTTGWSYNSVENAGSGSVVGYLHNGSDANTSSTGDSTLTIDKGNGYTLNGVCYYSAVINCGTGQVIGFLQNDSGNGKITIAVTSNTGYKAISGSSPATVSASGVSTYLESVGVANAFEGGLLVVPLNCVVVNEDIEFVVDDEYTFDITDLPAEAYNYIALVAVGIALIICATVVVTVLLVRRKKRKNTILENTNEIQD